MAQWVERLVACDGELEVFGDVLCVTHGPSSLHLSGAPGGALQIFLEVEGTLLGRQPLQL